MRILRSIGRFCECDPMDGLKIHIFPFKAENTTYYKPSSRSRLPRAPLSAGSASLMVAPQTAAFVPFRPIITLLLLGFPEPFARQGRKKGQGGARKRRRQRESLDGRRAVSETRQSELSDGWILGSWILDFPHIPSRRDGIRVLAFVDFQGHLRSTCTYMCGTRGADRGWFCRCYA